MGNSADCIHGVHPWWIDGFLLGKSRKNLEKSRKSAKNQNFVLTLEKRRTIINSYMREGQLKTIVHELKTFKFTGVIFYVDNGNAAGSKKSTGRRS